MASGVRVTFDTNKLMAYFISRSMRAVDQATARCLRRAQKHAPVRKLFRGTTHTTSHGFRVPKQRSIRFASDVGSQSGRQAPEAAGQAYTERVGHANSEIPVMRFRQPGGGSYALSGDLRRLLAADKEARPAMLPSIKVIARTRTGEQRTIDPMSEEGRKVRGMIKLTARGNYEIHNDRARHAGRDGRVRIGGRLRDALVATDAVYTRGIVTASVVSPVKDPETGYPYGTAQEFGTVKHRAHPYLRPALHETRGDLASLADQQLRT
jgi:hypothetical protein